MSRNNRKKIPRKKLFQSRGWDEISPGVYVAKENIQTPSSPSRHRINKIEYWKRKFEEAESYYYEFFIDGYQPVVFRVESDKKLLQSSEDKENITVKPFIKS